MKYALNTARSGGGLGWRSLLALTLALLVSCAFGTVARAEDSADPPRVQSAAGYTIQFISPQAEGNHDAETRLPFRFLVVDSAGKPVSGLNLKLTAVRDYSGQVKKEHNGPRTPNIGPLPLIATGQPGEYGTEVQFGVDGHWYIQLDGPSLNSQALKYRVNIGAAEGKGAGVNWDWLLWVGILAAVGTIVVLVGRKGEVFPTPVAELEPPVPAPTETTGQPSESSELAARK